MLRGKSENILTHNNLETLNKDLRKVKRKRDLLFDEYKKRCEQL